jgi:hypothetical protein
MNNNNMNNTVKAMGHDRLPSRQAGVRKRRGKRAGRPGKHWRQHVSLIVTSISNRNLDHTMNVNEACKPVRLTTFPKPLSTSRTASYSSAVEIRVT